MTDLLNDVDRFYYHRLDSSYRLERAGSPLQLVNPPTAIETPNFILYSTLDIERLSGKAWRAVGLDMVHGYGWVFERNINPNDDETEPIQIVVGHRTARKDRLTRIWKPILLILAVTAIQPGDVVEMLWSKGSYFGTVLEFNRATGEVKVEYTHPTIGKRWHGWRGLEEVTIIQKAKAA